MEETIGGQTMYTSMLQKNSEILYTAWWYQSDNDRTTSQLLWRWNSFRTGKRYALVNITAATPDALRQEINRFNQQVKSISG
ncbi:MAG: hypothetical protein EOO05_07540 [Chitinophagaceae bacterium]|nr:MAG: hypothetical protein EOO05_07540 [Chitinophagaceae bacterium]